MAAKTSKITKSAPVLVPVVETVETVEAPVVDAPVDASADAPVECDLLATIVNKITLLSTTLKDLTIITKTFQREYTKIIKAKTKKQAKSAGGGAPRPPSGFAKPAPLSNDLCTFLNIPSGSQLARTNVTRQLNQYIRDKNLQKPENKKFIQPDDKLKTLLNLSDTDELSYFNLQRYMKHLFLPAIPVAAPVVAL
jgi:chromatin remodeling complex protein RSC6